MEQFIIWIVTTALSYILAPKPEAPKPASLDDFNVPTADPERNIPVVFGTVWVEDPNTVWYGDLLAVPIRAEGGKGK